MVLSVSTTQTTLWDQITYDGDPSEFAWVLPIRGLVEVGVSSDALFQVLEQTTSVDIFSPALNCNTGGCNAAAGGDGSFGTGSTAGQGGVTVIAEEVVGPYETVQLEATDPTALQVWLDGHGYNIPADVQPVIDEYVTEGFGFLALRLVPGQGIDSMKPVRVTTPGASPELPLRMVAAGTGATTPITLWVIGEGRYAPQNFPAFSIFDTELVWNWDTQSSNYADLRQQGFDQTSGGGFLIEAGEPAGSWIFDQLLDSAQFTPDESGYADANGENALVNAQADLDTLLAGIDPSAMWVSRMSAELARAALSTDLTLGAPLDQSVVTRQFFIQNEVGTRPACPPPVTCGDDGSVDGGSYGEDTGGGGVLGEDSGCGIARGSAAPTIAVIGLVLAGLAIAGRKRKGAR